MGSSYKICLSVKALCIWREKNLAKSCRSCQQAITFFFFPSLDFGVSHTPVLHSPSPLRPRNSLCSYESPLPRSSPQDSHVPIGAPCIQGQWVLDQCLQRSQPVVDLHTTTGSSEFLYFSFHFYPQPIIMDLERHLIFAIMFTINLHGLILFPKICTDITSS